MNPETSIDIGLHLGIAAVLWTVALAPLVRRMVKSSRDDDQ